MSQLVIFDQLRNTRDLGGMKAINGRRIIQGKLYRSGHLNSLSGSDQDKLARIAPIIIDFRTDAERKEQPDQEIPGTENIHIPIVDDLTAGISREQGSLMEMFRRFILSPEDAKQYMCEMYCAFVSDKSVRNYAVFADLPLGSDGDWLSHASSAAVYADVKDEDSLLTRAVRSLKDFAFSVGDKIEDAFDLLFDNTVSGRKKLDSVTGDDAMKEFATGKTAFFYTGSDSYDKLKKMEDSVLKDEDLHFLPLYLGLDGEDAMGLTVDATRYLAVNDKASDAQKQAAVDFLEWLVSAEDGKRFVKERLGFTAPFNTFREGELSDDPLKTETLRHLTKDGETAMPDLSRAYPGGTFRTDVGGSLLQYTRGEKGWDDFVADVKTMWNRAVEAGKDLLQVN